MCVEFGRATRTVDNCNVDLKCYNDCYIMIIIKKTNMILMDVERERSKKFEFI